MSDGVEQIVQLAEKLQAPVCTTYLHNDAFPKSHPLLMGPLGYQGSKAAMKVINISKRIQYWIYLLSHY